MKRFLTLALLLCCSGPLVAKDTKELKESVQYLVTALKEAQSAQEPAEQAEVTDVKVGFFARLAAVATLSSAFTHYSLYSVSNYPWYVKWTQVIEPGVFNKKGKQARLVTGTLLAAWALYETYPLIERAFNHLMEVHHEEESKQ